MTDSTNRMPNISEYAVIGKIMYGIETAMRCFNDTVVAKLSESHPEYADKLGGFYQEFEENIERANNARLKLYKWVSAIAVSDCLKGTPNGVADISSINSAGLVGPPLANARLCVEFTDAVDALLSRMSGASESDKARAYESLADNDIDVDYPSMDGDIKSRTISADEYQRAALQGKVLIATDWDGGPVCGNGADRDCEGCVFKSIGVCRPLKLEFAGSRKGNRHEQG